MTLREWIRREKAGAGGRLSHEALAARLGLKVLALRRYLSGFRTPRFEVMQQIAVRTGGAVMPNDWFPELSRRFPADGAGSPAALASELASERIAA